MLNDSTTAALIAIMASGNAHRAQSYLKHFPRADRTAAAVRAALDGKVAPEVMAAFAALHPWLARDEVDDTPERIRLALHAAGKAGLNLTELARAVSRVRPDVMAVALDGLVEAREAVFERETTGGRIANRYRLECFADGVRAANEHEDPFADRSHRA